jgi:hypothetical protein
LLLILVGERLQGLSGILLLLELELAVAVVVQRMEKLVLIAVVVHDTVAIQFECCSSLGW